MLRFGMVICHRICTPYVFGEDNGKVVFSTLRLIQPLGTGGGWRALWLLEFHHPVAAEVKERSVGFRGKWGQPISGLTTRQMTGPEANLGPPAYQLWRLPNGSCSNEGYLDFNVWALLGSFCSRNSPLSREPFLEKTEKAPRLNGHRERRPIALVQYFLGKNWRKECLSLQRYVSVVYLRGGKLS